MLEFDAGVIGRELPVGLGVVGISIILPSCDFVGLFAGDAAVGLNWLAHPLLGDRVIADLIAAAAPATGLKVCRELDPNSTPKGSAAANEEMASRNIQPADFHGPWNATIAPSNQAIQTQRLFPDRR
jgi:hypothetical protein